MINARTFTLVKTLYVFIGSLAQGIVPYVVIIIIICRPYSIFIVPFYLEI